MKNLSIFKKVISFVTCSALSMAVMTGSPLLSGERTEKVAALSIAELQEKINENNSQIEELQGQLDALASNKAEQEQYQAVLKQQIDVIKDNLTILANEIASIKEDIEETKSNITSLEDSIAAQDQEIDNKIERFKKRLCEMYISGNDNLASVVVGTSSFYDMISRVEMVNRIASYDEQLINDILADIDKMEEDKASLQTEKLTQEMKEKELEAKEADKKAEYEIFNEKSLQTQEIIDRLALEEQMLAGDISKYEQDKADFEQQIQDIIAEQQRREAEEAARLAAQQAASQNYTPSYSSQPSYIPTPGASGFAWPAPGYYLITSGYGERWGSFHGGIDIGDAGIHGGCACASRAGTVIYVYNGCTHDYAKNGSCGCGGGYGNYVIISHDETYSTVYGHLASAAVSQGQYVNQGDVIGYIGSTGWSTGDHLHFEIRVNGVRVNPSNYV